MKRITGILALLLGLSMLTACGGQTQADDPPPGHAVEHRRYGGRDCRSRHTHVFLHGLPHCGRARESGQLLLAALDENSFGSVFSLNLCEMGVLLDSELADSTTLEDGMVIRSPGRMAAFWRPTPPS